MAAPALGCHTWVVVQRSATKYHLPSEKVWVFRSFRQKLDGEKFSVAESFSSGELQRCQCS